MKHAFRYIGIGFFLAGAILFVLTQFKVLDGTIPIVNVSTTTTTTASVSSSPIVQTKQISTMPQSTVSQTTETTTHVPQTTEETIAIVVTDESTTYSVATDLLAAGIITDANAFTNYMEHNNLSRYVQNGTFSLRQGMSLEELGKALTTYPGN